MSGNGRKEAYDGDELVLAELRRRVVRPGDTRRLAEEAGITKSAVSQVVRGHRPPPESLARLLGFRKVTRWERAKEGE